MRWFALLFTVFLDFFGFGVVFPLFFPMMMEPMHGFLGAGVSVEVRGLIAGVLVALYTLTQFFSLPVLGALSDRLGRKKVLIYSLLISFFGYLAAILGVVYTSVLLLLLFRVVTGIGSGNYAVAQAALADQISDSKERTKYFALINAAVGAGFMIGPFVGGALSEISLWGLPGFATPFVLSFGVVFLNIIVVAFFFKESLFERRESKISLLQACLYMKKAYVTVPLRPLFLMLFIFCFGWGFLCEFLPVYVMHMLNFGSKEIGYTYGYIGLLIMVCQGVLIRPLVSRLMPQKLLVVGLVGLSAVVPFLFATTTVAFYLIVLFFMVFFEALIFPAVSTLVSKLSDKKEQGEFLGINQSVQAAGFSLAPLFTGSFVVAYPLLPVWICIVCALSGVVVLRLYKFNQRLSAPLVE